MGVYARCLRFFKPYQRAIIVGLVLSVLGIGLNLLKPWPFKVLVDDVLEFRLPGTAESLDSNQGSFDPDAGEDWLNWPAWMILGSLALGLVLIHAVWGGVHYFTERLLVKIGLMGLLRLRTELYEKMHSLPLHFHEQRASSDSSFRVAYDSQAIQTIFNKGVSSVFTAVLSLLATFGVMLAMDWRLTLVSLGVVPFLLLAIRLYARRVRDQSTTIQESESAVLSVAQEGLASVRLVQAFSQEARERSAMQAAVNKSVDAQMALTRTTLQSTWVLGILMAAATAALYFYGGYLVLEAELSLGALLVFAAYLTMLYQPLEALSYTAWALEGAAAGAQRCFEVLDEPDRVADKAGAKALELKEGSFVFENVSFHYDPKQPVLHEVNLAIAGGTRLAIVGGTGAGKSTLLGMVPRFYDPVKGSIRLDGQPLVEVTKSSLRQQMAIVLQETLLFSTSIRENIAYGKPGASNEEIEHAAEMAEALDFIKDLADGFDTAVGERGCRLSVGQRQRLGLARAFLRDAPILLLDEPTSALDGETEAAIMETLQRLMSGRTTLMVTHRLAAIHSFSRVVVMEKGRLIEDGSPAELLAGQGAFYRLARAHEGEKK